MIEVLRDFPSNVVAVACRGHVSKSDYKNILVPRVENALKQRDGKIRLYYQIDADFAGIDPAAVWEDFKIGIEHRLSWERIAVVTDVDWIRTTITVFGFLISGEVSVFSISEMPKARGWIVAV